MTGLVAHGGAAKSQKHEVKKNFLVICIEIYTVITSYNLLFIYLISFWLDLFNWITCNLIF